MSRVQNRRHSTDEDEIDVCADQRRNDLSEINGHCSLPSALCQRAAALQPFVTPANAFERVARKSASGFRAATCDRYHGCSRERCRSLQQFLLSPRKITRRRACSYTSSALRFAQWEPNALQETIQISHGSNCGDRAIKNCVPYSATTLHRSMILNGW